MLNSKIKIIFLQVLVMTILIIGIEGCGCKSSFKNEQSVFNEIIHSSIKPDHILKIQNDNIEVNNIILKYFKIGENRESIIEKLSKMDIKPVKESQEEITVYGSKGDDVFLCKDDDKTIEIYFKFESNNKLAVVKSRYFRRE
jgi:hypothetical protein